MQKYLSLFMSGLIIAVFSMPWFGLNPAKAQPFTSPGTRYGINGEGPILWATSNAYVDLIWASTWNGNGTPSPSGANLSSNGYCKSGSQQLLFCILGQTPGVHTYNFYGEGIFDIGFGGGFVVNGGWPNGGIVPGTLKQTVNSKGITVTTCQCQLSVPPLDPTEANFNYTWIQLNSINPQGLANGTPNNFHLTQEGYPAWQDGDYFYPVNANSYPIFTNDYLKSFGPFCCIRFMDWMSTNDNTGLSWGANGVVNNGPYSWANRPNVNYDCNCFATPGGGRPCCYENMVTLCNLTNCDMWMNVPLQATDDWKVGFATYVKNNLNPNLHVYYEHGNELWNWGFIAWQWVDQQAKNDFSDYNSNAWFDHGQEMGKLLMSDVLVMQPIFNQVSHDFARPILAGQFVNPGSYCGGGLNYIKNNYGDPSNYIYGMAGAPYFGMDPTEFTGSDLTAMQANMTMANQYKIKFCAYEGGQGLDYSAANLAAQTSPAMATQYNLFAQMWQQNGGDLCNFFTDSGGWGQYGFWGHLPEGAYINNLSDPVCLRYTTIAALAAICNCGNAVPPPAPTPAPPPTPTPTPVPSPLPVNSGSGTGGSGSQSSSGKNTPTPANVQGGYDWSPGGRPQSK